ncbi:Hypothetical protein LBF_2122 [Leptospira biflexa serovar Patoc strain 'Patoc 1 (Ames)']|uniref:Uncharacterized protein n=1 Tax=Leptospira biflexa serovar Patoc (strain Patoc 1 / ATCC 23582 / Paris) TaxID=456481 RepID=B0ST42_LEPBP|nr:hypothetical protein [Leptospira biflexa]ABZ94619.1 Hypothetical protein LBF_2122 [Leptospira biflexa serovar Patoc strain 'Patoc 1 (Ames)']ABZ98282.1 Hypothetical protein LEPBI_I2183 [Leptospira biflexa serovar Patoc strain 'Patoc 1 (Paris)']
MKIEIIAKEDKFTEIRCLLEFDNKKGNFSGSRGVNISDNIVSLIELIESHDPKTISSASAPQLRDYLYKIKIPYDSTPISNMYRSFAVISVFLHLNILIEILNEKDPKYRQQRLNNYQYPNKALNDFMCFEKTGHTGGQPTLYVIHNDIIENNGEDLEILFEHGLIFKIKTALVENKNSFFVPFDIPDIRKINIPAKGTWNKIIEFREKSIERFVSK